LRERPPLDLIAIDNLPSLLPRESSTDFSAALLPQLLDFGTGGAWARCQDLFRTKCRELGIDTGVAVVEGELGHV
jgi:saccharopine dehydrogenase (NAD+, L-lysine-forming)